MSIVTSHQPIAIAESKNVLLYVHSHTLTDAGLLGWWKKQEGIALEVVNRTRSIAQSLKHTKIVDILTTLENNLIKKHLQAGFVGMMKVGKSTTLNALIGRRILPAAQQAETAVEVCIIHDNQYPNGLLTGELPDGSNHSIAEGETEINRELSRLNAGVRDEERKTLYKKLLLKIPFHFLNRSNEVMLEISDTPGYDEAMAHNISLGADEAIEKLAAFIIVLDYRRMKSEAEMSLLQSLKTHHPMVFKTPERLLVILNHVNAYYENPAAVNENSVKPKEAPQYVTKYLEDILNVRLTAQQVLPFSANWALESRLCRTVPNSMDRNKALKAAIVLNSAYNTETFFQMAQNDSRYLDLCEKLEEFSGIKVIEKHLADMFVKYGYRVLVEGTAHDTVRQIDILQENLEREIENPELKEREQRVAQLEMQLEEVQGILDKSMNDIEVYLEPSDDSLSVPATTLTDRVQNHAYKRIGAELLYITDNSTNVLEHIKRVNDSIQKVAKSELKQQWSQLKKSLNRKMKSTLVEQVELIQKKTFSILRNHLKENKPFRDVFTKDLIPSVDLWEVPRLLLSGGLSSIADLHAYIIQEIKREMRKVRFEDITYVLYFIPWKKEIKDEMVPHDIVQYKVNVQSLEADFSEAIKIWARDFKDEIKSMWEESAADLMKKSEKTIRMSWEKIQKTFQKILEEDKKRIATINQQTGGFKEKNKQLEELKIKLLITV